MATYPTRTATETLKPLSGCALPDPGRVLHSCMVSFVVAAVVVACFLLSTAGERPPALGWVAAFLFLAVESDVRSLRIPNWLTLTGLLGVLGYAAASGGWPALQASLLGAGAAFAALFPFFALRWLGAGDVKAWMVLGAVWGVAALPALLWWSLVCGGGIGLVSIAVRGGALDMARRWGQSLKALLVTAHWVYIPPAPGSAAASGIPFAVAIGLGVSAQQVWGAPWS